MTDSIDVLVRRVFTSAPDTRRDHDGGLMRRRVVVGVFLVIGAVILGFSLTAEPGDSSFYPLTVALAATWLVGGFLSGPIHVGRFAFRGTPSTAGTASLGIAVGVLVGAAFVVGAFITREIPALAGLVTDVLAFRDAGSLVAVTVITLGNGVAEEIFFRGAVYSAAQRLHPVVISTVLYTFATLASGNVMLGFAAIILGWVCAILRRSTDGVLAPICTHVVWGVVVLFALPPIFA
ncbi:CPBP family intramembrane glutamic endopeptidase [Gordonia sp. OPL2]|uniref:CPBP family intramembrane glutamic endopeptidase n=1 Tax=Gordonia sp. OPL2 TaxID=2486274 RepID=UPI00165680AB|nr:type II CAAX endopeptidase family protein [Gordonia sp. OPL2]ROZ98269.1 CPBP family intramembrane metalloprotease [Gordonia sp. OPL2]